MKSFCTVSTVLLRPTVAILLAANGPPPAMSQVVISAARSSAHFVGCSGDNAVNELGHTERETQSLRDGVEQSARRLFAPSHGLRIDGLPPQVKHTTVGELWNTSASARGVLRVPGRRSESRGDEVDH